MKEVPVMLSNKLKIIIAIIALGACISLVGVKIIDSGESGIKKVVGKVHDEALGAGFYIYNPFTTTIYTMNNKTQKEQDTTEVYTKDVQQVNVTYAINYNLLPNSSVKMFTSVGPRYAEILIPQIINGSMKNIIGKWDAIELVANRSKASTDIEDMISESLKPYGLMVSGFQLTNIKFRPEFETAVEAKVTAVQQAEQAKNQTVQVQEQAKQRVITAQADAQAMQIQTAALKESQSLVLYEAVKKWDGVLPKIITGAGGSIMNIPQEFANKDK
jgi:regulator of protease activity HflC (stomatin/prohibitin superfamily)